jgi:hypothetical protein
MASRSGCARRTRRPSRPVKAFNATPNSTPAKNQQDRRGEVPRKQQQRDEEDHADAADRDRPREIIAGLKALLGRIWHVVSFLLGRATHSPKRAGDQAASRAV